MIERRSNSCDAALGAASVALWLTVLPSGSLTDASLSGSLRVSGGSREEQVQHDRQRDHDRTEHHRRLPPASLVLAGAHPVPWRERPDQADQLGVRLGGGD